jgi:predicted acyltransferase
MASAWVSAPVRDQPLDAYRGLAVAGMALVNLEDPFTAALPGLAHSSWNGLTFADLVFPFFVLGVGLSTPLAVDRPEPASWIKVVGRALGLVALGLVFNWLLHPRPDFWTVRASGVLQRIGLVYLACAGLAKTTRTALPAFVGAAIVMGLHGAALLAVPAPGEAVVSLAPGQGLSAWLDRTLLPGRLPRSGYDPEGVLSSLSAIATGLIGVGVMRHVASRRVNAEPWIREVLGGGLGLVVLGLALSGVTPINKQLWTPSYALLTAGLGLLTWSGLTLIWPAVRGEAWSSAITILGRTALTFYTVHMLVIAALMPKLGGLHIWDRLVGAVGASGAPTALASFILALVLMVLCFTLLFALNRRGWLLRL